jgi:hypothetical protein
MASSADPVSAVQQYIDAFNKGDVKEMAAVCADPVTQSGAIFTVALRRVPAGWRIASWAWAKGTASVA